MKIVFDYSVTDGDKTVLTAKGETDVTALVKCIGDVMIQAAKAGGECRKATNPRPSGLDIPLGVMMDILRAAVTNDNEPREHSDDEYNEALAAWEASLKPPTA